MPKFDPNIHHRRSIRLPGYDYSQAGAYFVTIDTHGSECLLGDVVDGAMKLSPYGKIVQKAWAYLPAHYPHIGLDAFCIMPNHVHAIIVLNNAGPVKHHPLSEIVRAFKTFSAIRINELRKTTGIPVWQRNYYEHIIRNDEDYQRIRQYIQDNPDHWEDDDKYFAPHP